MKIKLLLLVCLLGAAALWAQVSTVQPLTEFIILTNPSTNLNAGKVRMTFDSPRLNPTNFVMAVKIELEFWNKAGTRIIDRDTFTPTAEQMATWYSRGLGTNSAEAWLKAALLNKAGLTEKLP